VALPAGVVMIAPPVGLGQRPPRDITHGDAVVLEDAVPIGVEPTPGGQQVSAGWSLWCAGAASWAGYIKTTAPSW
jgi:hypothetical protein